MLVMFHKRVRLPVGSETGAIYGFSDNALAYIESKP